MMTTHPSWNVDVITNTADSVVANIGKTFFDGDFSKQIVAEYWRDENMEIELEVYYEKGYGLFAVDSEAVTAGTIHSPYTGELCIEPHKI